MKLKCNILEYMRYEFLPICNVGSFERYFLRCLQTAKQFFYWNIKNPYVTTRIAEYCPINLDHFQYISSLYECFEI